MSGAEDTYPTMPENDIEPYDIAPIEDSTLQEVEALGKLLDTYKYMLYSETVQKDKDTSHNAQDMGAMFDYHGTLLQSYGFWIGLLDHKPQEPPILDSESLTIQFQEITTKVKQLHLKDSDSRILTYNLLFKKSVALPFQFNNNKELE